jgi:hypothetical protein
MNSERFDPLNQTPLAKGQGKLHLIDHDHYFTHLAWFDCDPPFKADYRGPGAVAGSGSGLVRFRSSEVRGVKVFFR